MFNKAKAVAFLLETPDWLGDNPDDDVFKAMVILLTRMGRRKDTFNCQRMTGYPKEFTAQVHHNLRRAGIWVGNGKGTSLECLGDEKNTQIVLTIAALCGAGMIERTPDDKWQNIPDKP